MRRHVSLTSQNVKTNHKYEYNLLHYQIRSTVVLKIGIAYATVLRSCPLDFLFHLRDSLISIVDLQPDSCTAKVNSLHREFFLW